MNVFDFAMRMEEESRAYYEQLAAAARSGEVTFYLDFESVEALIADIQTLIDRHNTDPKPLRWTKSADDILASIERFCRRTLEIHAPTG